jgi:hypothetical protein
MALLPPNPALATETVTIVPRTKADGTMGDRSLSEGSGTAYPCIATMQVLNRSGVAVRAGAEQSNTMWNVLIFSDDEPTPAVRPGTTILRVAAQGQVRSLKATTRSTPREPGCWYVLAEGVE